MELPIDKYSFSRFIEGSDIFRITRNALFGCLRNWYNDQKEQFLDDMRADLKTVMETYHFHGTMVSFNKNFNFDPPLDTITCKITINDAENCYCISYIAVFDYNLNMLDDIMGDKLL